MSDKEKKKTRKKGEAGRGPKIDSAMLERLEETAAKIGVEIRYEAIPRAGYAGGLCRIKDKWVLILNRTSLPVERAHLLAEAIATKDTESMYVPPDVREIVDWVKSRRKS